jgi:hypothetical protein
VARYDQVNEAEQGFFDTLINGGQTKTAAELAQETVDALDIPSVSPSILDELENQASGSSTPEESPPEQAPAPAEGGPALPVEGASAQGASKREDLPPDAEAEPAAEPELPSRATHGKLFSDKSAHPVQILEVLTNRYGTEWADWESDTLWWSLRKSFGSVGEVTRNKIMALRLAAKSDMPWLDWDVFEDCGQSWNDTIPIIGSYQPMTPMQLAFAIQVCRSIRPDDEFAHEVKAYVAAILDDHGWVWAPKEYFGDVQEILERGREHLVGLKQDVIAAWKKVRKTDPHTINWTDEEPLTIHIMKLFTVQMYLGSRDELYQEAPGQAAPSSTTSPPVP